jgi:hypothetical protein
MTPALMQNLSVVHTSIVVLFQAEQMQMGKLYDLTEFPTRRRPLESAIHGLLTAPLINRR